MSKVGFKAALCTLAAFAVLAVATLGTAQEKTKVKGLIVARDGASMKIKGEMASWTVVLSDDTKVKAVKGSLGLRKETLALTDLIPGLPVEVEMVHNGTELNATSVKFKADDLKTARQIQAGLHPTGQEIQGMQADQDAMSQKFGQLGDYDVKGEVTVYFSVSSAQLDDDSKQQLKQLADNALTLKGYMIQVAGYTDASGNAAYNQDLSDKRADAVVNYLQQDCKVPLYRVLSPEGMGESNPSGSNESQQGKKENRRVEIKILVNRGLQS